MRSLIISFCFVSIVFTVRGQELQPDGGGDLTPPKSECVTREQREAIEQMLDSNRKILIEKGLLNDSTLHDAKKTTSVLFDWPLHQVTGGYYSYYGISNYVDLDTTYPGHLLDWNCGTRTYDLASGYNHAGSDIFLTPFSWNNMEDEHVEIIAAAPGTIIGTSDGNFDHNCAMGSGTWNAVYIQHADGTVAWYGHMKNGTPISSPIGTAVTPGQHLGFVGSSGSSTGPHLHFEVHDAAGKVREPYTGACNTLPSLWNVQKPYYESQVNTLMTHFAPPGFAPCPMRDTLNTRDTFLPGSTIYFISYYHDEQPGQTSSYSILRPDGSVYHSWSRTASAYYAGSYWYNYFTIPASEPLGHWKFIDNFQTVAYAHDFYILNTALQLTNTQGVATSVYPNPVASQLNIEHALGYGAKIFDLAGREIYATKITSDNEALNTERLVAGTYLVQLTNTYGEKKTIRVVKE